MVKLLFAVRKLAHLSDEEFHRYWREEHGPLARKNLSRMRVKRYVQNHTADTPLNGAVRQSRGAAEAYDGMVEVCWDSMEDVEAALSDPEGVNASLELPEDEQRFIDLGRSCRSFVTEEVFLG